MKIKSKYKYVYFLRMNGKNDYWRGRIDSSKSGFSWRSGVKRTEEEAAKAVDLFLISKNEQPCNGFYKPKN